MAPTSDTPAPASVLVEHLRIERDPMASTVRLIINGEPFPYLLAADEAHPVSVDLVANTVSGVRFTLLAKTVEVSDRLLADVAVQGHDGDS